MTSHASSLITPPYSHSQSVTVQGQGEELLCEDTLVCGGGVMCNVIIIIALQLFTRYKLNVCSMIRSLTARL